MLFRNSSDGYKENRLIFVTPETPKPADVLPPAAEAPADDPDTAADQKGARVEAAQTDVNVTTPAGAENPPAAQAPAENAPADNPEKQKEIDAAKLLMEQTIGKENTQKLTVQIEQNPDLAKSMQSLIAAVDGAYPNQREVAINAIAQIAQNPDDYKDAKEPNVIAIRDFTNTGLTIGEREAARLLATVVGGAEKKEQKGYTEADKAEMITAANAALQGIDLATLKPDEREAKIGQVMMSTGVSVVEVNGKYVPQAPTSNWEMIMNRVMGFVTFMGSFVTKIRSAFDKASGKATETDKKETPKDTPDMTAARERIDQKVKEGKTLDDLKKTATAVRDDAKKEIEKLNPDLKKAEEALTADEKKIKGLTDLRNVADNTEGENANYDAEIRAAQQEKKNSEDEVKKINEKIDAETKKMKEAEADLAVITVMEKEASEQKEKNKNSPEALINQVKIMNSDKANYEGCTFELKDSDGKKNLELKTTGQISEEFKKILEESGFAVSQDKQDAVLKNVTMDNLEEFDEKMRAFVKRATPEAAPVTTPAIPKGEPDRESGAPQKETPKGGAVIDQEWEDEFGIDPEQRFQIALEDTINVVQDKIRTAQASADNAQKNISQTSLGEGFESIGALGGILWETVQEKEDRQFADIQRVQKNLDSVLLRLNQLDHKEGERAMLELKNIRKSLGLAELPQQLIGDYNLFQRKVSEAKDARSSDFSEKIDKTVLSVDSFGERVISDPDTADYWVARQKDAVEMMHSGLPLNENEEQSMSEILGETVVKNENTYEFDIDHTTWRMKKMSENACLLSLKGDPLTSIMFDPATIRSKENVLLLSRVAQLRRADESYDDAGMNRQFEIAGDDEPMAYLDLADLSDDLTRGFTETETGFSQILSRRYRIYSGKEDLMDLSQSQNPITAVSQRVRQYYDKGVRNFYFNIHAHGSNEAMHFGKNKIDAEQMTALFKEFQDCRFTVNSISCFGGGMGVAMRKFEDENSASRNRISVFTQTKSDVVNLASGSDNGDYSTEYNAALSEALMQGVDGRPGKKLTYGEAHVLADRIAKEKNGTDAEVSVSQPGIGSARTADTDRTSESSNIA